MLLLATNTKDLEPKLRQSLAKQLDPSASTRVHCFTISMMKYILTDIVLYFSILFMFSFQSMPGTSAVLVSAQCLDDQQMILLQLRDTLEFNHSLSARLASWDQSTDCCLWNGVKCSSVGQIIGLDLNNESISGGIKDSSSLFHLQFLRSLNLAFNKFNFTQIPPGLKNLTHLVYLNLSRSDFGGQVPQEIGQLTRLVILDLSNVYFMGSMRLKLESPTLGFLVQNLTDLRELHLDSVDLSGNRYDWGQVIGSSLPNLRVLSLSDCLLSGPIDASLPRLQSLSEIHLSRNNLNSPVPESFENFMNLRVLRLAFCNLTGIFPGRIFQLPYLLTLDLSYNDLLSGFLPEFPTTGLLEKLIISNTNFSGQIPDSIGNLGMLSQLDLARSNLSGPIPHSIARLMQLNFLDISSNTFAGLIPSFQQNIYLTQIDLSRNTLSGPVPSAHFEGLTNLVSVDLRLNEFNGSLPSSLFSLPLAQIILLSGNKFEGPLPNILKASLSPLEILDLSSNRLEGPIPKSFFELGRLYVLSLSFNHLKDIISLEAFQRLGNLTTLDLSSNNFLIETKSSTSNFSFIPQFNTLNLASCNLQALPDLKNQQVLSTLDLSDNRIGGEIPNWIWELPLSTLNLSHNLFVKLQEPYQLAGVAILDLHRNLLSGEIPVPPQDAAYVDYSANNFSSSNPGGIGNIITFAYFFSVSDNRLSGVIPDSLCNDVYLQVLDLSGNKLQGTIPPCLWTLGLGVVNLAKNNLSGSIEGTFPRKCALRTLDLHANSLEGKIPESLANCSMLEVLNLGNNRISDAFPCFLKSNNYLKVIVLRSNKLHGEIHCGSRGNIWEKLQIIDIASNNFSGHVPHDYFSNWEAMLADNNSRLQRSNLRFLFLELNGFYYQDSVTVTYKGVQSELVKILTLFTSIDFSDNNFGGEIPESVGNLTALYVLNLSDNAFHGLISSSIQKLSHLESLDLSLNKLTGKIPTELASLTFLSFLNLSDNQLEGRIPKGSQLQTFTEASFEGNKGLCGFPLKRDCIDLGETNTSAPAFMNSHHRLVNYEDLISAEVGYVVGLGIFVLSLIFCGRWSRLYYKHVDRIFFRKLREYYERRNRRRRADRNLIRRLQ